MSVRSLLILLTNASSYNSESVGHATGLTSPKHAFLTFTYDLFHPLHPIPEFLAGHVRQFAFRLSSGQDFFSTVSTIFTSAALRVPFLPLPLAINGV
jgi:hypothetical protein